MGDREKKAVDDYMATINRLEPDVSPIDASAFYASAAISLKRIADSLEKLTDAAMRSAESLNNIQDIVDDTHTLVKDKFQ